MEIEQNPFAILGATSRHDRRQLQAIAEEASLLSDENAVREAATTLTHPRKRLAAEIAWLPGLGPAKTAAALSMLETHPENLPAQSNLPPLARANLLADGALRAVERLSMTEIAQWIVELATAFDQVTPEDTMKLLNEDRSISGFPQIADTKHIDTELRARRQSFRRALIQVLDQLPPTSLVEVITATVDNATQCGNFHAPILIDDLVDSFEVEAQGFLNEETDNINTLISQLRETAGQDDENNDIEQLVQQLEQVVKNWDLVAQPIQVSARSRGLSHEPSNRVATAIRKLAVELVNEHGLLEVSRSLTKLQQSVFAEVDRIVEQSHEDVLAIDELSEKQSEFLETIAEKAETWKKSITYEAEIGVVFKDKLRISPEGVEWKGAKFGLDEIDRVRWGGTSHSVNGVPTGTTFCIVVGASSDTARVELRKENVYTAFVDRLWRAVGVRILTEMLTGLRNGDRYHFGPAIVSDFGVELERSHFFAANERVPCKWTELSIGNRPGAFSISKRGETTVNVELSYQDIDNVHILEAAMRTLWKNCGARISDILPPTS